VVPIVILVLVAVALVVTVLGVATGRLPADPLADAVRSTPDPGLPERPQADDVEAVRFDTALRGYRMEDVDDRLEVLRDELAERERTVAELRAQPAAEDPAQPAAEDRAQPAVAERESTVAELRAQPAHDDAGGR
jgi:DivIVA domain-containing protein